MLLNFIKSPSKDLNEAGRKARDVAQQKSHERIYFIPNDIDEVFITVDQKEQPIVIVHDKMLEQLDVVKGFADVEECFDYAKIIVLEAGLSEKDIRLNEISYVLVSIVQNDRGYYAVYGQGIEPNQEMGIRSLGSYKTLEEAREEAEDVAMDFDCPLVELLHGSRGRMRDLYKEFMEEEA